MDPKLEKAKQRRENLISYSITAGITLGVGATIFCLYFFLMGHRFIDAVNGMALTSILLVGGAILTLLARLGAFDIFAYGFTQLGHAMFSNKPNKYDNMADYKQAKYDARKNKRKSYIVVLIVASLFIVALVVLEIIYHVKIGQ